VHTPCLTLTSAMGGALLAALLAALAVVPAAYADTAPVARDDTYSTAMNLNLVIGAPGVLANDTDADGDPLSATLVAGAQHGNVSISGNGAFTYVPTTNYVGPDQFTYRACDPNVVVPPAATTTPAPTVVVPPPTTVVPPPTTVVVPPTTPVIPPPTSVTPPAGNATPAPVDAEVRNEAFVASLCDQATVFITVKGGVVTTPPPVGGGVVIYPTCAAATRAGVHDIPFGDPRYLPRLDRDHDGIACEINGNDNPTAPVVTIPTGTQRVINGTNCRWDGTTWVPVTVVRPPGNTTVVNPPAAPNNVIIVPPAQPPANTFITPQAPSTGAVATGDGTLA
jgi:hypothetical protein